MIGCRPGAPLFRVNIAAHGSTLSGVCFVAILRFNPLGHVLSALVLMMPQHAASEVIPADSGQSLSAVFDPGNQGRTMSALPVTIRQQVQAERLRLQPLRLVGIELHRAISECLG